MENVVQEKVHNIESDSKRIEGSRLFKVKTFNKISERGLTLLETDRFNVSDNVTEYDAIILRSQNLHEEAFPESVLAVGRAGAGVNNIPIDHCTNKGIVVFNTPGANANAVKELVIAGMLMSSRRIVAGIRFVDTLKDKGSEVTPLVEKNKSSFSGFEIEGKKLGVIGLGAIGLMVANTAIHLGMRIKRYC